jgi:fructose-1-phosphate kinase PfkB-like protein
MFFKNHKIELRLTKDAKSDAMVDATPSITKEDVIHISKKVVRYVAGGVLIVLAGSAVIDTAKYSAMTGIEDRSARKQLDQ